MVEGANSSALGARAASRVGGRGVRGDLAELQWPEVAFGRMMKPLATRLVRGTLLLLLASIGFFHLQILLTRLADGSVLQPLVVARWIASLAVCAVWLSLRRRGVRLFRGRAALVFWLLLVLIHGVGLVPGAIAPALQVMPTEAFLAAVRISVVVAGVFTAGVLLALAGKARPTVPERLRRTGSRQSAERKAAQLAFAGPRAPPL